MYRLKRSSLHRIFVTLLLTLLCSTVGRQLGAQVSTASLNGTVLDPSGAAVPNAKVTVQNDATGLTRTSEANGNGAFSFDFLPIGTYTLEATATGFGKQKQNNILLNTADNQRIDFHLALASDVMAISVTVNTVALDTVSPQQSFNLSTVQINQLPVSRQDWTSVLQLGPGISTEGGRGSPAGQSLTINGLPPAGFNLTVDGTNATSNPEAPAFGFYQGPNIINTINNDAIAEVSVVKGIAPATIGGTMSGNVNIVSKSGSNQFHGSLFEINEVSALDARNQFVVKKPRLTFNEFGGSIGGPILRKKLFFFGSYEGARVAAFQVVSGTVATPYLRSILPTVYNPVLNLFPTVAQPADPTALTAQSNGTGSLSQTDGNGVARLDYNVNENNLIYVRYIRSRPKQVAPNIVSINSRATTGETDAINAGYTHAGHNWTSLSRFGYNKIHLQRLDQGFGVDLAQIRYSGIDSGGSEQFVIDGAFLSGEQQFAITLGKHAVTSGFIFQRQNAGRTDLNTSTLAYGSLSDFQNNIPNQVVITFDLNPFNLRTIQYGGFLQDDYKLTPNFTLNLGVRYDYFTVPKEDSGRLFNRGIDPAAPLLGAGYGPYRPADSLYNGDFNNFQPRLGFTYSPSFSKESVIRGGMGIFTSPHPIFGGPIDEVQNSATQPFRITLSQQSQIQAAGLKYPLPRASYSTVLANLQNSGIISTQVVNTSISADFPNPYSMQWNLGIERVLPYSHKIEIDYIGNRGMKENMTITKNLPDRTTGVAPRPTFPTFRYYYAGDSSNYHGLQVQLAKAPWKGLSYGSSYTWSRAMSFADANLLLQTPPQDAGNIKADYGRTPYDVRHRFTANFVFVPPIAQWLNMNSRGSKLLLNGWQISGIVRTKTGSPLAVQDGSSSYPADRPDVTPGVNPYLQNSGQTRKFLNPAAFTRVPIVAASRAQARGGNLHRFEISGPGQITFDATIAKTFEITDSVRFQLKASAFNALNRTNYSGVVTNVSSGTFGQLTSATARTVQLTGRFTF